LVGGGGGPGFGGADTGVLAGAATVLVAVAVVALAGVAELAGVTGVLVAVLTEPVHVPGMELLVTTIEEVGEAHALATYVSWATTPGIATSLAYVVSGDPEAIGNEVLVTSALWAV
jgi:hypothetical protein